jgi:hypothetical protein
VLGYRAGQPGRAAAARRYLPSRGLLLSLTGRAGPGIFRKTSTATAASATSSASASDLLQTSTGMPSKGAPAPAAPSMSRTSNVAGGPYQPRPCVVRTWRLHGMTERHRLPGSSSVSDRRCESVSAQPPASSNPADDFAREARLRRNAMAASRSVQTRSPPHDASAKPPSATSLPSRRTPLVPRRTRPPPPLKLVRSAYRAVNAVAGEPSRSSAKRPLPSPGTPLSPFSSSPAKHALTVRTPGRRFGKRAQHGSSRADADPQISASPRRISRACSPTIACVSTSANIAPLT